MQILYERRIESIETPSIRCYLPRISGSPIRTIGSWRLCGATARLGYVTEAERFGWSFVFHLLVPPDIQEYIDQAALSTPWWLKVDGAFWKHPEGPSSNVDERADHPAVHVS